MDELVPVDSVERLDHKMSIATPIEASGRVNDQRWECVSCGFALWTPLVALRASGVGLYDDARFPGRLIVAANEHFEHLDTVPADYLAAFMADVQTASIALRQLPGVDRVNVSILGNKDPHLHAHVIPRRNTDANVGRAPWDGAAPHVRLDPCSRNDLVSGLRIAMGACV